MTSNYIFVILYYQISQHPIVIFIYRLIARQMPTVEEVFDAGEYSQYSYVKREDRRIDSKLERVLTSSTPGAAVVGPSKAGKTALVKNTARVKDHGVIQVRGPEIGSVDELWNIVLDELDAPKATEEHRTDTEEESSSTTGGVNPQDVGVNHTESHKEATSSGQTRTYGRRGLRGVVDRSENKDFVLLLDDFHYISDKEVKKSIVQSIKGAIEDKVPICVALVTHRGETLQQKVPDIDDRVMTIQVESWKTPELKQIATKGEEHLNIKFSDRTKERLAQNAVKSPMIMQRLCSSACEVAGVSGTQDPTTQAKKIDLSDDELQQVITLASDWMGKRMVVKALLDGVNDSGRVKYDYGGEKDGDTYLLTLRAIATGDPTNTFHFSELKQRIKQDCVEDSPSGSQIDNVCEQLETIANEKRPGDELIEWENEEDNRVLMISDPELLFLIRHIMNDDDYEEHILGM